jgi:ubiquinone/menaquinone biosynthesis C-methylase UbiE
MNSDNSQKDAFIKFEANAWFNRNKELLLNYSVENDKIISLLNNYKLQPSSVLEIGCSAGYRLDGVKSIFPNADVCGIEPSFEAINYGRKKYPAVNFIEGTSDDLSHFQDQKFDLVIIGFVFYVVDRNLLIKSISEVDRVLKNGGSLILIDFYSEKAIKRNYHHITDFTAYSFKQLYDEIFTASKLYHLIDRTCYNHQTNCPDINSNYQDLYSISLLRKDQLASY